MRRIVCWRFSFQWWIILLTREVKKRIKALWRGREPATVENPLLQHYRQVIDAIIEGRLVLFLGAGVNLCTRQESQDWRPGAWLPSGGELARHLAKTFNYPRDEPVELARVAQWVDVI